MLVCGSTSVSSGISPLLESSSLPSPPLPSPRDRSNARVPPMSSNILAELCVIEPGTLVYHQGPLIDCQNMGYLHLAK